MEDTALTAATGERVLVRAGADGQLRACVNGEELRVHCAPGFRVCAAPPRHVHLLRVRGARRGSVLFIGPGGLPGGGKSKDHNCDDLGIFKCSTCPFVCPKGACSDCCIHKVHNCAKYNVQQHATGQLSTERMRQSTINEELSGQMTSHDENFDFAFNCSTDVPSDQARSSRRVAHSESFADPSVNGCESAEADGATVASCPPVLHAPSAVGFHARPPTGNSAAELPSVTSKMYYLLHLLVTFLLHIAVAAWKTASAVWFGTSWGRQKFILSLKRRKLSTEKLERYLLRKLVTYRNSDCMVIEKFRHIWKTISDIYERKDRLPFLESLLRQRIRNGTSLLDICNLLNFVVGSGLQECSIVCNEQNLSFRALKKTWMEKNKEKLYNTQMELQPPPNIDRLVSLLAENNWSVEVCEILFKCITGETSSDLSQFLLFLNHSAPVPEAVLLPVILSSSHNSSQISSNNCTESWSTSISYQIVCNVLAQMHFDVDVLAPLIFKLLQASCSPDLLLDVIIGHRRTIRNNMAEFIKVLKLLINYQVRGDICKSALLLIRDTPPNEWLKGIDKDIVSHVFGEIDVYTKDDLIKSISDRSNVSSSSLETYFAKVKTAYTSPSGMQFNTDSMFVENLRSKVVASWREDDVAMWAELVNKGTGKCVSLYETIAVVMRAAKLAHKMEPRNVQVLTLLVLLHPEEGCGRLVQVKTGEGKSLIVAMLAAVNALKGHLVDVITTSTELSVPEVANQKPFFSLLKLTVSENSGDNTYKTGTDSPYKCEVVYGTASDFQADILRKEFQGFDCRAKRSFDVVIVDEVDSMLYDRHTYSVRLSEPIPGMNHLEIALAIVWERVNRYARHLVHHEGNTYFIPDDFERREGRIVLESGERWLDVALLVHDKEEFIVRNTQEHTEKILRVLSDDEKNKYNEHASLLSAVLEKENEAKSAKDDAQQQALNEECEALREAYKKCDWLGEYPVIDIPEHLRDFALKQLPYWIRNAINAAFVYRRDYHYTVQNDRIVPVLYNESGVLQPNMVWSDGLAQFLQMKEDLPVEPESVTTNFISNVSFFLRYRSAIFGLTGTIGKKSTRDFLTTVYSVDMAIISPHQRRHIADNEGCDYLGKELASVIEATEEAWYDSIIAHALFHAHRRRAVLIICRYISHVKHVAKHLRKKYESDKVFTYTGEESSFEKKKADCGQIIVATNIAGRGTDIKTSVAVEIHGGLYVMITFLPESNRVESQNAGRTSREGKKGMVQLIMHIPNAKDIRTLKKLRREKEDSINRKAIDEAQKTQQHDELFKRFCDLQAIYLPSVPACQRNEIWQKLKSDWDECEKVFLCPARLRRTFIFIKNIDVGQEFPESLFESYKIKEKKDVLNNFCDTRPYIVPADMLRCFREGKVFETGTSELAKKYNWGEYERKGLDERWGLWFKSQHFETKNISSSDASRMFDEFQKRIEDDAKDDKLIRNHCYYILKGNKHLRNAHCKVSGWNMITRYVKRRMTFVKDYRDEELESAILCYDRAISLDPNFSLHAYYNKACALLSFFENKGERQRTTLDVLRLAAKIIRDSFQPSLLALYTFVAQTGAHKLTALHIKHQYDVLSQQLNYITNAREVINPEKNDVDLRVSLIPLKRVMEGSGEDHSKAVSEVCTYGLTHLFTLQEATPFPWFNYVAIALIGFTELIIGGVLAYFGFYALAAGPLILGIHDLMSHLLNTVEGVFSWSALGVYRAVNFGASVMTAGWRLAKGACKIVTEGIADAANTIRQVVAGVMQRDAFQQNVSNAEKASAMKNLVQGKRREMATLVKRVLLTTLSTNSLVKRALRVDEKKNCQEWQRFFLSEATDVLNEAELRVQERELQELLLRITDKCAASSEQEENEPTEEEITQFMTGLEDYITVFSATFAARLTKYEHLIKSSEERKGNIVVRGTRWVWKGIIKVKDLIFISDVEEGVIDHTEFDIRNIPPSEVEKAEIPTVPAEDGEHYTSKVQPNTNDMADIPNVHQASFEGLTQLFTERVCQVLFLNMRYRDNNTTNTNVAYEIFEQINEANKELRQILKLKNTTRKNCVSGQSTDSQDEVPLSASQNENNINELNNTLKSTIESFQDGLTPNIAILDLLASVLQAPILVFESESGKLIHIKAEDKSGKPILLRTTRSSAKCPSGGWLPLEHTAAAKVDGEVTFIDAVWAQMDKKGEIQLNSHSDLIRAIIHWIYENAEAATELFEMQNTLDKLF